MKQREVKPFDASPSADDRKKVQALLARIFLPGIIRMLVASLRIQITPDRHLPALREGGIIAFWHGNMVTGWMLCRKLFPRKNLHAVVSLSQDGAILASTLSRLGYTLIRGSSSRGSDEVKRNMLKAVRNGDIVAITPDGPRGPRQRLKYGTLKLVSQHRLTMYFAKISHKQAWQLDSWDRFQIPRPFSRVEIEIVPVTIPEIKNQNELENIEKQLAEQFSEN
ncbi:lysophospholipid acyltransferase family protein [Prosthecochloris sp. HL-130-GSB]|jgi:Kdo2-lipid IVA 3' secondary acyltransferase|uniref:DUF374 domain-containing protein n=1 Tax=Prosthecochloris aestuarii TaxID=1102 RepID=A0A831SRM3_PROAE|nr:lysophospholipid acyltransferase family protein [Prosthecochloris sp. HL-130-GSB]ARM30364.1 hypothetical protein B9H02_02260 [Prosthecochloris sp. HL-130-GSB]MBO8091992.1 lysophospholipid acyltransferase family protein [Prosthecochloris sp.]HED31439.1 DUF374 domain-containing protein [Prosthecochloris aestuarii]